MFCIYLRTNSDLCHLQHKLIGFYNGDEKCLLRGTNWAFKYSSLRFVFKGLKSSFRRSWSQYSSIKHCRVSSYTQINNRNLQYSALRPLVQHQTIQKLYTMLSPLHSVGTPVYIKGQLCEGFFIQFVEKNSLLVHFCVRGKSRQERHTHTQCTRSAMSNVVSGVPPYP